MHHAFVSMGGEREAGVLCMLRTPSCRSGTSYAMNDTDGSSYNFNICGRASFYCAPSYSSVLHVGTAVQYWGASPPCNQSAPSCVDGNGQPICCTQSCEVLGTDLPVLQVLWQI